MTIVKHSAFSTEVSKREVFWPPVFLICQHSQLFSTLFFIDLTVFFSFFSQLLTVFFSVKKYCVPARNTCKVEGKKLICTHIYTWFQRGACVKKYVFQHWLRHFHQILHPRKTHTECVPALLTCISIARVSFFLCSSIVYVHFHCSGRLSGLLWDASGLQ